METKVKKCFSETKKQKRSLVEDVPWGNPETYSNHAIMKNASNSCLMPLASAKLILEGKKTNAVKNPMLGNGVDSNPNAVLSRSIGRGRLQKLKFTEIGQHLKNTRRSVMTSQQDPLKPHLTCSEFVLDLEDVDGVVFASFPAKEILDSYTVDDCGEREVSLLIPDSDCQVRLRLLETKLLEDLKFFRHKQVIHPNLQEVGLKLGSVDPGLSIDLKYLGVQLPLSLSKDYVFGASGTSSQELAKTYDFRKIKGWQGKFHNASGQEAYSSEAIFMYFPQPFKAANFPFKIKNGRPWFLVKPSDIVSARQFYQKQCILKGSLKNQSVFCSEKLDRYLENEVKLMETSLGFSTLASNSAVLCQLPSKDTSNTEKNQVLLHNKSSITLPSSYTFKPCSLPSVFRQRRRKTKNKQETSRGRAKFSNIHLFKIHLFCQNRNMPSQKTVIKLQSSNQVGDEEHVLLMSELGRNEQERQRTVQQAQQESTHLLNLSKTQEKLKGLEQGFSTPSTSAAPLWLPLHQVPPEIKNTEQKDEFIPLRVDEKTSCWQEEEAMLLEVTMSCSESEENEPKSRSGGVTCSRDAVTLEMDKKDAETMEKLSSDALIVHPDTVLSDHSYVIKVKAEKQQHMKLPEDTSDSISLLTSKPCGSGPGSLQNIQRAHISSSELHAFSLDTVKSFLIPSSSLSEQSEVPRSSEEKESRKRKTKCRKYKDSYLDRGFTCVEVKNEERPQCDICLKVVAAKSVLPSKLKRHLESLHPNVVGKPRDFYIRKCKEAKLQQSAFSEQSKVNTNALLSSYKVAYHVAQSKKPHTIAEELILPIAVFGEDVGKQLLKVPLSNTTISQRINDMAEDINDQLICNLKGKEFALQLDKATDNHKDSHLICYVKFVNEKKIVEDLLFFKEIKGGNTGEDLFEVVDDFMVQNQMDWEKCVGVCTDGDRSVAGCYQGLQARIRSKAPNAVWTHCIMHREALAAENLSGELHDILKTVIKVVNFIKTRPMKASFFAKMCDDMGAEHSCLLFYSSSLWLSLGNSLLRLYEFRNEIYSYLHDEEHCLADKFIDSDFLIQLAFLSDLFEKLNTLNKSLRGSNTNILQLSDKVAGLKKKVIFWKSSISKGDYKGFPSLDQFLQANEIRLKEELSTVFVQYLSQLHLYLQKNFPEDEVEPIKWLRDPFNAEIPPHFNIEEAEQLIDVSTDSTLKVRFQSQSLPEFWCQTEDEYPVISKRALRVLIQFATTDLCKAGFSAVAVIKSKYRSKINIEKEMRVAISKITPRFDELCKEKQAHPSH